MDDVAIKTICEMPGKKNSYSKGSSKLSQWQLCFLIKAEKKGSWSIGTVCLCGRRHLFKLHLSYFHATFACLLALKQEKTRSIDIMECISREREKKTHRCDVYEAKNNPCQETTAHAHTQKTHTETDWCCRGQEQRAGVTNIQSVCAWIETEVRREEGEKEC